MLAVRKWFLVQESCGFSYFTSLFNGESVSFVTAVVKNNGFGVEMAGSSKGGYVYT